MRIDAKLVREIMLVVEEYFPFREKDVVWPEDYTKEELDYHCLTLIDAGLIKGSYQRAFGGTYHVMVQHLTSQGHEYLEAIRNESVFKKVQDRLKDSGLVTAPLDILVQLAAKFTRDSVGLS